MNPMQDSNSQISSKNGSNEQNHNVAVIKPIQQSKHLKPIQHAFEGTDPTANPGLGLLRCVLGMMSILSGFA